MNNDIVHNFKIVSTNQSLFNIKKINFKVFITSSDEINKKVKINQISICVNISHHNCNYVCYQYVFFLNKHRKILQ